MIPCGLCLRRQLSWHAEADRQRRIRSDGTGHSTRPAHDNRSHRDHVQVQGIQFQVIGVPVYRHFLQDIMFFPNLKVGGSLSRSPRLLRQCLGL